MKTLKKSFYFIIFILFISFTQNTFSQSIRFFREKIDITVNKQNCQLEGTYYFANNNRQSIRRLLFYPFIINKDMPFPDSISVLNSNSGEKVKFHKSSDGIRFPIKILPEDTVIYNIYYSQKIPAKKFKYILTTTKKWGKPFKVAEYSIKLLKDYKLKELSIDIPFMKIVDRYKYYYSRKEQYLPDIDLFIRWE